MDKESDERKTILPHFGLAEDILGLGKNPGEGVEGSVRKESPTGPERIYDFADQVRGDKDEDENRIAEEQMETWVTFSLANEFFGLPVSNVNEILRTGTITRVPHAPYPVKGVTNIRGRVLPVVDLRVRLGLSETKINHISRILVAESRGRLIGLLVDSVQQIVRLNKKTVQPPPPDVMTAQSDYILGVYYLKEDLVILLNVDRLLLIKDPKDSMRTGIRKVE